MSTKIIKTTFQVRRGTAEAWERVNPILAYGEIGFVKDTYQIKIGDGDTPWTELPFIGENAEISDDGKSIEYSTVGLTLFGYNKAAAGDIPVKGNDHLEWAQPLSEKDVQQIMIDAKSKKESE